MDLRRVTGPIIVGPWAFAAGARRCGRSRTAEGPPQICYLGSRRFPFNDCPDFNEITSLSPGSIKTAEGRNVLNQILFTFIVAAQCPTDPPAITGVDQVIDAVGPAPHDNGTTATFECSDGWETPTGSTGAVCFQGDWVNEDVDNPPSCEREFRAISISIGCFMWDSGGTLCDVSSIIHTRQVTRLRRETRASAPQLTLTRSTNPISRLSYIWREQNWRLRFSLKFLM